MKGKVTVMDCLFCEIIKGNIPSTKIYEDDLVFAFNDIAPAAPVHVLIVPKTHIASPADINGENSAVIAHIFEVAAKIAVQLGLDDGWRVVTNCGEAAGQSVKHIHFHLLGGKELGWPPC